MKRTTPKPLHGEKDPPMNPALRDEVGGLRGAMASQAMRTALDTGLPIRFTLTPNREHGNRMDITDTKTGRTLSIGLCDLHGAIKALSFFNGGQS